MLVECKECKSRYNVSIDDDRECCGVGGFCHIISFSHSEFSEAYSRLRGNLNGDIANLLNKTRFVIPLNTLFFGTEGINNDLAALVLLNEKVCLDSLQIDFSRTDQYFNDLISNNLVSLINFSTEQNQCHKNEFFAFKEKCRDLFYVQNNFEYMAMKINYAKLNCGQIVPGWAASAVEAMSVQGSRALICRSDIVGVDNHNWITKQRQEQAAQIGYDEKQLVEEIGLKSIASSHARKVKNNEELEFLFELGIKVPSEIPISDLKELQKENAIAELRREFKKFLALNPAKRKPHVEKLRKSIANFNSETERNFQTKTLFLSGLISSLGGVIGGIEGSMISGLGSATSVYYATKIYNNKKRLELLSKYVM